MEDSQTNYSKEGSLLSDFKYEHKWEDLLPFSIGTTIMHKLLDDLNVNYNNMVNVLQNNDYAVHYNNKTISIDKNNYIIGVWVKRKYSEQ